MSARHYPSKVSFAIEAASAALLAGLLFAVIANLGATFFTLQESTASASVAAMTHDGVAQHHLSVYLCIDSSSDVIQGTVVVDRSTKDLNLRLPGRPNLTTSLGFLKQDLASPLKS